MRKKITMKPLAAAIGTAMAASLMSIPAANADENPFGMTELSSGYMVAGSRVEKGEKMSEGTSSEVTAEGEGPSGEGKKAKGGEGKCGEGKCGGGVKSESEGKCGEGKCGGSK